MCLDEGKIELEDDLDLDLDLDLDEDDDLLRRLDFFREILGLRDADDNDNELERLLRTIRRRLLERRRRLEPFDFEDALEVLDDDLDLELDLRRLRFDLDLLRSFLLLDRDRNGVGDRDGDFLDEMTVSTISLRNCFFRFSRNFNNSVSDSLARLLSSLSLEALDLLSTGFDGFFP